MDTTENMLTAPYYPGNQTAVTHTYETLEQEVHWLFLWALICIDIVNWFQHM